MEKFTNLNKLNESDKKINKEIILTMPLNPRHFEKLGFYGLFAYLNSIAKNDSKLSAIMLNLVDENGISQKSELFSNLKMLDILPNKIFDEQIFDKKMINEVLLKLFESGIIKVAYEQVTRCECGKMQFKADAKLYKTSTTLLGENGKSKCCDSYLETNFQKVIMSAAITKPEKIPELYPKWAEKDIKWIFDNSNYELLLSRQTEQKYSIKINDDEIYIDPDNLIYFYLYYLNLIGYNVSEIISGVSLVKQVAFMISFSAMSGIKMPNKIHFLPKINFDVSTSNYIQEYIKEYGKEKIINSLLWATTGNKQNINMSENFIKRASGIYIPNGHLPEKRNELIPQHKISKNLKD